jgi:hypothetical protein
MPPNFEPLLLRHRDARAAIAVGQSFYWRLVRTKRIAVVGKGKAGRAIAASIRAYVAELEAEKAKEAEAPVQAGKAA